MPIWTFDVTGPQAPVLALDLSSLSVVTFPGAGGSITVEATEEQARILAVEADRQRVTVSQTATTGRDRLAGLLPWTDWFGRIRVTVPQGACLEGRLSAGGINAMQPWESVRLTTMAGSIKVGPCQNADLRAEAGSIRVASVNDGRFTTQAGSVVLSMTTGDVMASTEAGSVKVERATSGHLDLRSSLGSIKVGVPASTAVHLDCSSRLGSVTTDLSPCAQPPQERQQLFLNARTEFGTVRIRRA